MVNNYLSLCDLLLRCQIDFNNLFLNCNKNDSQERKNWSSSPSPSKWEVSDRTVVRFQCDVSITDPIVSEFQAFIETTKVDGLQEYKIHSMRQGEGSTLLSWDDEYGDAGKWHDVTRPVVLTGGNDVFMLFI